MNALFVIYLIGCIVAVFQDFKRREIDDWLNLFLFFSGVLFLFSNMSNVSYVSSFMVFSFFMMIVSLLFYHARVFSGGDAKLLFGLSPIFFTSVFYQSLINLTSFIAFLFLSGAIYGVMFILFFVIADFKNVFRESLKKIKKIRYVFILFFVIFIFSIFYNFIYLFIFSFLLFFISIVALSVGNVSLVKKIYASELREGDWLFEKIKFGGKIFDYSWDGLSRNDIRILKKYNKKISIKDGVPYAPAFMIALILYLFRNFIFSFIW